MNNVGDTVGLVSFVCQVNTVINYWHQYCIWLNTKYQH